MISDNEDGFCYYGGCVLLRSVYKSLGIILILAGMFRPHDARADDQRPARVLAVLPGSRSMPVNVSAYQAFRSTIIEQSARPVDFFEEAVELYRFDSPELLQNFSGLLRERYRLYPPDVVITGMRSQLNFLTLGENAIFTNVPVIGLALLDSDSEVIAPNAIPVQWNVDCLTTIKLARRLQPRMTNLVVVTGLSPVDRRFAEPVQKAVEQLEGELNITWLDNHTQEEVLKHIDELTFPGSAVFYVSLNLDRDGIYRMSYETMDRIHKVTSVPVYGYLSSYLDYGLTGGFLSRTEELGAKGAELAMRIIEGDAAGVMQQEFIMPNFYYLNWPEMKRFGFSAKQWPEGTVVLNRPPTLWETYWPWILGGSGLSVALFSLGGVVVLRSRYQARSLREENRQRALLENIRRQAENGELAAAIAHEINQPLASILSNAESLGIMLEKGASSEDLNSVVGAIIKDDERAGDIIRKIRDLYASRDVAFEPVDLNALIAETRHLFSRNHDAGMPDMVFTPDGDVAKISGDPVQLQQMLYNLMHNSLLASRGADHVLVSTRKLEGERHGVVIELRDFGPGVPEKDESRIFEPYFSSRPGGTGLGLAISQKIIKAHKGSLTYRRHPEKGSIFTVILYKQE